ncbi:MAG: DUF1840 domain-containing protein [Gammaproteobacteria bacterium]|nr:DUF1840 domain-containing protein [Gammaproteobacteria bacterium]
MLVTFSTPAYADITMFGDVATHMLRLMGHSETVPGAILAEDVPMALERLVTAVEAETSNQETDNDEDEPAVSLSHRALPLIKLLEAAAVANSNVMWDKNS